MEDPVVGGYTPDKVALRRAIGLAWTSSARSGSSAAARPSRRSPTSCRTPPATTRLQERDERLRPAARANALLDLFGYVDRDGDGWRELPDGKPLRWCGHAAGADLPPVRRAVAQEHGGHRHQGALRDRAVARTPEGGARRQAADLGIGLRSGRRPDGQGSLYRLHGPQSGGRTWRASRTAEFDALYERMARLPDGPEREALFARPRRSPAYMPYKPTVHRISTDLWYPWLIGYRRPLFWNEWWHLVDVDHARLRAQQ
jgi:hypothetical protein